MGLFEGVRATSINQNAQLRVELSSHQKAKLNWQVHTPIQLEVKDMDNGCVLLCLEPELVPNRNSRTLCNARTKARRFCVTHEMPKPLKNRAFKISEFLVYGRGLYIILKVKHSFKASKPKLLPLFPELVGG